MIKVKQKRKCCLMEGMDLLLVGRTVVILNFIIVKMYCFRKEKDQSSLASGPINPILHPRLHRRAAPSQQASQSHQLLVQSNNNFNLVGAVKSVSFSDYSQQYRLGNEPTRKRFLDSYKHFMDNNKITPIWRIPVADMINKIPLDFYKLYQEVCGRNGMLVVRTMGSL